MSANKIWKLQTNNNFKVVFDKTE